MNWYDIQNTDCISAMHKVKSDSVDHSIRLASDNECRWIP